VPSVGVGPLPARLLSFTAADGELVPAWLSDRDRPWLRDLLGSAEAAAGQPFAWLQRRWQHADPDPRAGRRAAVAQHVVLALLRAAAAVPAVASMRQALFAAAACAPSRGAALASVAAAFVTTEAAVLASLFADLPPERRLRWPSPPPEPLRVALLANLALAQGLLLHADAATLRLRGASRALLRTAWLHGTALAVQSVDDDGVRFSWRPAADRRRHARALASLLPLLPWARRFEMRAHCRPPGGDGTLVVATGDPILPGSEPRAYDSALERAFARDFAAAAADWQLLREPVPVRVGDALAFPDFELRHRPSGRCWLLEIAGLRDVAALPAKAALLAAVPRLVLCLPRRLLPAGLAAHPRVVPFTTRVAVVGVLAAGGGA
jgi:predicted nuclease of restriction endonuclease-like RecB superfamily